MTTAIWWLRRDLRLADNQALTAALNRAEAIIPTFIFDPVLLNSPYNSSKRLAFLLGGLRELDKTLRQRGSRLIIRRGRPVEQLAALVEETGAEIIFAEQDFSPYARRRDEAVADQLPLELTGGLTVYPPTAVLKDDDSPYVVYTPYSKSWKALPFPHHSLLPAPEQLSTPDDLASESIPAKPDLPPTVPFPPGEAEAQSRLQAFVSDTIQKYGQNRDRMDLEGTSRLSPYLRFGMVSARQAAVAAMQAIESAPDQTARKGATTWLNELIWREFYIMILYHFPRVRSENFYTKYNQVAWQNDDDDFAAWTKGRTGYPVVDAAMRQLVQSGWMHNRARMIVASFLVKHLLIDWRQGERFFMEHLVDGDPAANNGGWQWSAGTGTDAAPYFRVFNPILQSKKFDPDDQYIRRWLPELAQVPDKDIHTPWKMTDQAQQQANCLIGQDYPAPIVEHQSARQRALETYGVVKSS